MPQVFYKRRIEGFTVPAVIHNGSYHFIWMPVYADGSTDCWGQVSLSELPEKFKKGWLVAEIPLGESLSVFGLGSYTVIDAKWDHTSKTFVKHITNCVKQLNPKMEGLFQESEAQKKDRKVRRVSQSAQPTPFRMPEKIGFPKDGKSTSLLYKKDGELTLTSLTIYEDASASIDCIPNQFFSLDEIAALFEAKTLCCNFDGEKVIRVHGLGTITATVKYSVKPKEKLKEVEEMFVEMAGEKSVHEKCRDAYYQYLIYPTEQARERLKETYEAVPEHERMYLGDMDTKDGDYRRIIFEPDKKREV